jgi:predicted DNA-binding transcriptional regulator YafY
VVRAEELAHHFEVTQRTVYRDIAALGEAGVPICGEAGIGYTLVKGYHLPPVMLTTEEAGALFVGSEMVRQFADASLHGPTTTALDKLRAVLPPDCRDKLERLVRNTVIVGPSPSERVGPSDRRWLLTLQQAIVHRQILAVVYRGKMRTEETAREVEPLGTVFNTGAWYLVAWCRLRSDYRFFRVDRISEVKVKSERFAPRPDFSLTTFIEQAARRQDLASADVRFAPSAMERVRREGFSAILSERMTPQGVEIKFTTFSLEWLADWLLSFGEEAEAIAPESLREIIASRARAVATRYEKTLLT